MKGIRWLILVLSLPLAPVSIAEVTIELQTTVIRGNQELPKILYVVPWQTVTLPVQGQQELELYSLEDDLFEPVLP